MLVNSVYLLTDAEVETIQMTPNAAWIILVMVISMASL